MRGLIVAMVGLPALAGCAADSAMGARMRQNEGMLALEPHASGRPGVYRLMAVVFPGTTGGPVNYNREADRIATVRALTDGACRDPVTTLEATVPNGRSIARNYWRVEC